MTTPDDNVIDFPGPRREVFTPPEFGFCAACGGEVEWPKIAEWPECCPHCKGILIVTSWDPKLGASFLAS